MGGSGGGDGGALPVVSHDKANSRSVTANQHRPPPNDTVRLAIVTLAVQAANVPYGYDVTCGLLQWCQSARRLETALHQSAQYRWQVRRLMIGIKDEKWVKARAGCDMEVLIPSAVLGAAAHTCATKLARSSAAYRTTRGFKSGYAVDASYFKEVTLQKWHVWTLLNFDLVCFADADLEMMPFAEVSTAAFAAAWERVVGEMLSDPAVRLLADPDPRSPFNAGFMLIKPSMRIYEEGIGSLSRCLFNRTLGWDLVGRPSSLGITPLQLGRKDRSIKIRSAASALKRTRAYRANSWDFPGADTDQGLFFYHLFVRRSAGAYGRDEVGGSRSPHGHGLQRQPLSRHWWASFKPWCEWPLGRKDRKLIIRRNITTERLVEWIRHGHPYYNDPGRLSRLYAYVMRLEEPAGNSLASTLVRKSTCWQAQWALRRALEALEQFGEIFRKWEDGFAGPAWVAVPT